MTLEKFIGLLLVLAGGGCLFVTRSLWWGVPIFLGVIILWYDAYLGAKVYYFKDKEDK